MTIFINREKGRKKEKAISGVFFCFGRDLTFGQQQAGHATLMLTYT